MSIKRIALCVMYAMIAMFVINTGTANAEDEVVYNTQQVQTDDTAQNTNITDGSEGITQDIQNEEQSITSDEQLIEQGAVSDASEDASSTDDSSSDNKTVKKTSKSSAKYSKADLRLLSALIYCEAGVEPYAGKLAVGIVVMNRKESASYPNSVKSVIYQKFQFSPVRNGMLKKALAKYDAGKFKSSAHRQCIAAAKAALSGIKTVEYGGKEINFKKYKSFSGGLKGYKVKIKGHRFK